MFQAQIQKSEIEFKLKLDYSNYCKVIGDLLCNNYKSNYLQIIEILPIISGINYQEYYKEHYVQQSNKDKENSNNKESQNKIKEFAIIKNETSFWFYHWNKNHKKKNWTQICEQRFPRNLELISLKMSNSYISYEDLCQLFQNPFYKASLVNLDLHSNSTTLKEKVIQLISETLPNLLSLSLQNNKLVMSESYLLKALPLKNVLILNVENCNLQDPLLNLIAEKFPQIQNLNISKNQNLTEFFALNSMKNIKYLNASFTQINLGQIAHLLQRKQGGLEVLDISNTQQQDLEMQLNASVQVSHVPVLLMGGLHLIKEQLDSVLRVFVNLERLDLQENVELSKSDFSFSQELDQKSLKNIKWLSLRQCSFDEDEQHRKDEQDRKQLMVEQNQEYEPFDYGFIPFQINMVHNLLKHFKNLTFIDFSLNLLHDEGVQVLINGLVENNNQIETLQLGKCGLTYKSINLLVNKPIFQNLKCLGLRENEILDEGVQTLVSDREMKSLEFLNLSACKLSEEGFKLIMQWQNVCTTLVDFRFSENMSRSNTEKYLAIMESNLHQLKSLKKCSLGSGIPQESEIPQSIKDKNIMLAPFFGDGFD